MTNPAHEQARQRANDLNMQVYEASCVLKLAAFAAESRRVLTAINEFLHFNKEMKAEMIDGVPGFYAWQEMEDVSADAIRYAQEKAERASDELLAIVCELTEPDDPMDGGR